MKITYKSNTMGNSTSTFRVQYFKQNVHSILDTSSIKETSFKDQLLKCSNDMELLYEYDVFDFHRYEDYKQFSGVFEHTITYTKYMYKSDNVNNIRELINTKRNDESGLTIDDLNFRVDNFVGKTFMKLVKRHKKLKKKELKEVLKQHMYRS
jgi:hypothetical protein